LSLTDAYARRLRALQTPLWKRVLDVQAPYRWNLRRLHPGRTLDVGCGIGRNLAHLGKDGQGVDPNRACVAEARARGFEAFTPDELPPGVFDSVLIAHVLEHLDDPAGLVRNYLPRLKPGGQLILITPQERGFRRDETHVRFLDLADLRGLAEDCGLVVERAYSFPFPRWAGRLFTYNECVLTARRPTGAA
jgi:2-polyprenyl-3-methyl-5-hydroxy-6-metoxy-1,4-benzoquinol methylase